MGEDKNTRGNDGQIAKPYQNIPEHLPFYIFRLALENPFPVDVKVKNPARNGSYDACRQIPQAKKVYSNDGNAKIGCRSHDGRCLCFKVGEHVSKKIRKPLPAGEERLHKYPPVHHQPLHPNRPEVLRVYGCKKV